MLPMPHSAACPTDLMVLCSVLAGLRSEGTIRSMSPSFSGVKMRPVISVEQKNAESETTFMRNPSDVSESFHDPEQLCLHQMMQPSAAKQMVHVTGYVPHIS
jgi:hypothetical protein